MGNRKKEFIQKIHKNLTENELHLFYNKHNIVFEEVDLFRDFVVNLTYLIGNTYLGDSITPPNKQVSHFNWCWEKNIKDFKKENIQFKDKGSHYSYLLKYFNETFYIKEDKNLSIKLIIKFWMTIMTYIPSKNMRDLGVLLNLYKLMHKNLII